MKIVTVPGRKLENLRKRGSRQRNRGDEFRRGEGVRGWGDKTEEVIPCPLVC